jgi:transcriptional regulator with XRE-family HTH domain
MLGSMDDPTRGGEDDASPAGLPQRLREARKAKGLSMEAAAQRAGVSKSSWQRWEVGTNTPRDHWPDVERVLGKSRLELEFGLTGELDPPYKGWPLFLDWLETVDERIRAEPWMIDNLRRLRVPQGEITLEGYKTGLFWMLSIPIERAP